MIKRLKSMLAFVLAFMLLFSANSFSFIAQGSGVQPNVSNITSTLVSWSNSPDVYINGSRVYATHYIVTIDGVEYEAYCADPAIRGPESTGAIYELKGAAGAHFKNILRNGYTNNSQWSNANVDPGDRAWLRYVTRVAIAMVNNPAHTFTGDNAVIIRAQSLINGTDTANEAAYPAIMVNGVKDAADTGRIINSVDAKSQTFNITYNRKTNLFYNPFRFEWAAGTPAGAKLIVNGSVIATAPTNPTTVYRNNITSFTIEMPNTAAFEGQTAAVNLVGIHNNFADSVWLMQNTTNPDTWQDIVFYIPEISASAAFSFITEDEEPPPTLKIKKISNTGASLNGAQFTITGNGRNETITVNGEFILELDDWVDGTYTVTEIVAPTGYDLNASPQTFTISNNSVSPAELIFVNKPPDKPKIPTLPDRDPRIAEPPAVRIQKIDALTRENIPDALIRIRGGSSFTMTTGDGQTWAINNTGIDISVVLTEGHTLPVVPEPTEDGQPPVEFELIDGVLTIYNIPWGYYHVEEERAPQGYSLLPQHTAYSFWVLPPNVTVTAGLPAGGDDGDEEPGDGESDESGGEGLAYLIDEDGNVNSILITFENYPFGSIELTKLDELTGEAVEGAIFRIEGYFPEGNENGIPTYRMDTTDASGQILWEDLPAGMYTITEVNAPAGYHTSRESVAVPLTWGQEATVIVTNKPYGSLEILKIDELTGEPVSGAVFEVEYLFDDMIMRTTVTTSGGRAELDGIPKTNVSIREIFTPHGYVTSNETYVYPIEWGQTTTVTITNTPKSSLEVYKIDGNSSAPLSGAVFELKDPTTGETWQATTGSDGIALFGQGSNGNELIPGKTYILTEIQAPAGYMPITEPREIVLSPGDNNRETITNTPKSSLEVYKVDGNSGAPLSGAVFELKDPTTGETWQATTGGDGIALFGQGSNGNELIPGKTYILTEIHAPAGYVLLTEPRQIVLSPGDNNRETVRNYINPSLTIVKRDRETGQPLAGAVFSVRYENGQSVSGSPFTTDADGQIVLPWTLFEGNGERTLIVTEIEAPPGYVLSNPNWQSVTMRPGENNVVTFENYKKPTLTITKYDELTGEPLAGATFRLWKTEGETWSENQITDANGRIVWTDLDPGIYSVQEIDEPYGYFRDPARKEILLEGGDNKELTFFNRPRPTLIIQKRDAVTGEPLAGTVFRVQALEGLTVGEFITDADGMIELSPRTGYLLDERIYRITEVTPPVNYLLGVNPVKDVMLKWYEPTELIFENLLKPTLIFIKRDGMSGRGVPGATFRVQHETSNGGVITLGNYITKCGLIVIPYAEPGWYIFTEISPAPGYSLPSNPTTRVYFAPGANSYTHSQTNAALYVDPRTNPLSGNRGMCGDCCGFLCSTLCAGNCGNSGDGTMSSGTGNSGFGNITITNGSGDPLGGTQTQTMPPSNPTPATDPPPDFSNIKIEGGTVVYLNPDPTFSGITITFGSKENE